MAIIFLDDLKSTNKAFKKGKTMLSIHKNPYSTSFSGTTAVISEDRKKAIQESLGNERYESLKKAVAGFNEMPDYQKMKTPKEIIITDVVPALVIRGRSTIMDTPYNTGCTIVDMTDKTGTDSPFSGENIEKLGKNLHVCC